jgi:hypothetical protein
VAACSPCTGCSRPFKATVTGSGSTAAACVAAPRTCRGTVGVRNPVSVTVVLWSLVDLVLVSAGVMLAANGCLRDSGLGLCPLGRGCPWLPHNGSHPSFGATDLGNAPNALLLPDTLRRLRFSPPLGHGSRLRVALA